MNHFPDHFLWGASSSAFQIEGGWNEGGKGMTVADFNSFQHSDKQDDTTVASDFCHHWKEDIDMMKELGLKAYRFSLSWARIIPDGDGEVNPEGIAFYQKVIDYLIAQGIQPLVTLYHFDLPYALVKKYNGWENRACAYAFERYARVCFQAFGDRVKYWQMINEQNLMVRVNTRMNIYTDDDWEADRLRVQMDYHMFLGHALAVNACHELVPGGQSRPRRLFHLHLSADQQAGGCLGSQDERLAQNQLLPGNAHQWRISRLLYALPEGAQHRAQDGAR